MASADLRTELDCSICLSLYTDPVSLRCGHNFCRSCIVSALDAQEAAGVYSCPDCRAEYPERPALEKNRKLGNIVERFLSARPDMEETGIFCTYCTKSPVPAVRTCLQCEASFCGEHLSRHNKSSEHILVEPTATPKKRKCSTHKEVLKYYCPIDAACICVSCWVAGDHKGHDVELLDVASEKEKEKLRKYLEELNPQKAEILTKLQNLQDRQRNIQEKASDKRKNVRKLFMDIKKQLKMAEKKALSEISRQEEKIVSQISDLIKKLEIEEDELSRKMRHVEEMCHVTDPIRLLQESDITVCGHGDDEDTGADGGEGRSEDDLDEVLISLTLHRSMRDIVTNVTSELRLHVPDILLDEDTAHEYVKISEDLKTATTLVNKYINRPESPGRFLDYPQVLSRCGLSSGRHYWEVEWNQKGRCNIGMSYPSIEREGLQSGIIYNAKSWCLDMSGAGCAACHRSVRSPLSVDRTCPRFGVFLDYEAGRLSFYQLCDPIRHLHTFTASFSQPLHVVFHLCPGASVRIISTPEADVVVKELCTVWAQVNLNLKKAQEIQKVNAKRRRSLRVDFGLGDKGKRLFHFRFLLLRTTMASADLRAAAELDCSICLSLYTDPVSLRCGHNFCRFCIVTVLDAQEAAGVYSCPDCRAEYPERPALEKKRKLGNIVERFLSARPDMEEIGIFCTYCTKSPVTAVKTCLQCEASFCGEHLSRHSKSSEHTLVEPTATLKERKCSTHKEVLKYYCSIDAACICVSCWVAGDHKGHAVELLDVAFEKEKEKLRKYLEQRNPQKAKIQTRLQNLQDRQRNIQEKASDQRKNVRKLFMDIKEQLEMAEKKALSEISRQEEKIVSQISDLIKKLEIEEDELSRKMRHVEEMCHVTDPIRLLQESDITVRGRGDDEDTGGDGGEGRSEDGLDEVLMSLTLHRSMRDIVTNVTSELGLHVPDILLDEDTANIYVKISEDLKTATASKDKQNRPESPGRFLDCAEVLSRCGLSSRRHYWEVEWNQKGKCDIGLSYPSIERKGQESSIRCNDKSWCLAMSGAGCTACHRSVTSPLSVDTTCPRLGVFLDYEAGRLSFYQLCDPIRHLHTFTASFSQPLHVLFYVRDGASVRIIS
ncbi:uncharacterized protein LOC122945542 [Bufo gargarizans]|uniref:uncharacterized protein LOC122945542 n=1 Tax=Bufo gargarizans TaxID=30331 RepID=UPI001CF55793|nr:uncharacterized protein LOC122945542 [Bufo gargarizans]